MKKAVKIAVLQATKTYEKQPMEEINKDRYKHGKKSFDGYKSHEGKEPFQSATDPESGVFHKGEHEKCFTYHS